ncbi:MAG: 8-oxo-dGTP diphosphatase [Anaerolineales bacterium]|jgi:8-oxo-dGTP diphosphatase|nr:8-oxo-dGTP diphosphatase [Anaerolineales bacterium]
MKLATLIYLKRAGQTLMIHRIKKERDIHSGKWNGLGGKLEAGESPEACAIREVREESGLEIKNLRYGGLLVFAGFKGEDWYVWAFTADQFDGQLIDSNEGNLKWIPDDEIRSLPLWPSDLLFLDWLQAGKIFSARFSYSPQDEMLAHQVVFYE